MNATADFICRLYVGGDSDYSTHMRKVHPWAWECKCPRTFECEWQGDERAATTLSAEMVLEATRCERMRDAIGKVFEYGGVRLRVVDIAFTPYAYYDAFLVTLAHNPHGALQALYRPAARALLRCMVNIEARVRGFMLQPVEGREMPAASWLAKRLL